jgi:hypothetical protein
MVMLKMADMITNIGQDTFNQGVSQVGSMITQIKAYFPLISAILVFVTIIWFLMRLKNHPINVQILELVKGGYVSHSGRFAIAYDKENDLEFLRPMFSKARLPSFPREHFHKVKGMPFIGLTRDITLVKYNKYTYKVLTTPDNTNEGNIEYEDIKRWTFIEEKRKFLLKLKQADFMQILAVAAPLTIIFSSIIFFCILVYLQMKQTDALTARLDMLYNIIQARLNRGA